ncbi:MAG: peptidylprolyl isomerase [Quisquiliibacterium sp.]
MSNTRFSARVVVACALLAVAPALWAQNAAVVNNKPIPKAKVDEFMKALAAQGRPETPELRAAVRDELIARELFAQEAERKGLARKPDVQMQIENTRQQILIQALIREYADKHPIKDEDIKAEYDKLAAESSEKEYKARHILVESEDSAKKIIEELGKGAKFEDLAKQSKDPGSAQNGGDLDWNTAGTFVKPFSDAMVALAKGKYTEAPVKTQFGWHVIRLDDMRDGTPPPMEQVRPQIQQELERRRVEQMQKELRAKAKIQ